MNSYNLDGYSTKEASIPGIQSDGISRIKSDNNAPGGIDSKAGSNLWGSERIKHPTSFGGTIFHIIFLSGTSTILLIPPVFTAVGLIPGSVTILVTFSFYFYSMRMLIWCADEMCHHKEIRRISYVDLLYETFSMGPAFLRPFASSARIIMSIIFIGGWFGGCIFISLLMAQISVVICNNWSTITLTVDNFLLILLVPTLILNMIRTLKFLEPVSVLGFIINLLTMLLVVYYGVTNSASWEGSTLYGSLHKIPLLIASMFSNMNLTGIMLSLKSEMKHPKKFTAPWGVMTISYGILLTFYLLLTLFFAFKFGSKLPTNAVNLMPPNIQLSFVTFIVYVVGQFLIYPIVLYVPLSVLRNQLVGKGKLLGSHEVTWDYALRIFLTILAVVLAYVSPGITFFLSLFGSVISSLDSIILPAVMQTIIKWKLSKVGGEIIWILLKNSVIVIVGLYLIVRGIMDCIVESATGNNT